MSCNSVYVAAGGPTPEVAAAVLDWPDLRERFPGVSVELEALHHD